MDNSTESRSSGGLRWIYTKYDEEERAKIRQGNSALLAPHGMFEVVYSAASVTGHPYHVRQMGTQRIMSRHHSAADAVEAGFSRVRSMTPNGMLFTRDDEAWEQACELGLVNTPDAE